MNFLFFFSLHFLYGIRAKSSLKVFHFLGNPISVESLLHRLPEESPCSRASSPCPMCSSGKVMPPFPACRRPMPLSSSVVLHHVLPSVLLRALSNPASVHCHSHHAPSAYVIPSVHRSSCAFCHTMLSCIMCYWSPCSTCHRLTVCLLVLYIGFFSSA